MADEENVRRCVRDELELNLVQRTRNLIRSAAVSTARDEICRRTGRDLVVQRSEYLRRVQLLRAHHQRMAQDLPAMVELKDPLQLQITLGGLERAKQDEYRAFQKLFGFWIGQARRLRLAPMENLKIILLLMIWSS